VKQTQDPSTLSDRAATPKSGDSVRSDFCFAGPKLFVDAAWKLKRDHSTATTGLGIYLTYKEQHMHTDALILAIKHEVPSPIQAEAHALSLAGHLAAALELQEPVSSRIA
jgi:hypothetical protein